MQMVMVMLIGPPVISEVVLENFWMVIVGEGGGLTGFRVKVFLM